MAPQNITTMNTTNIVDFETDAASRGSVLNSNENTSGASTADTMLSQDGSSSDATFESTTDDENTCEGCDDECIDFPTRTSKLPRHGAILDIGGSCLSNDIEKRLREALAGKVKDGEDKPVFPDELLYNDEGLAIWSHVIFTPEFYQTADEIALFEHYSPEIVKKIPENAVLIDLGAGDLRKVGRLLEELEKRSIPCHYIALDLSKASLRENIDMLMARHKTVRCSAIWGNFEQGATYIKGLPFDQPIVYLSLGSVLFNDSWSTAISHLKMWAELMNPGDRILAGMDCHSFVDDRAKTWASYHSHHDMFGEFFDNGLAHANRLLGGEYLKIADWEFDGAIHGDYPHDWLFTARRDIQVGSELVIPKGFVFKWHDANKYSVEECKRMAKHGAGLSVTDTWQLPGSKMTQFFLQRGTRCPKSGYKKDLKRGEA